MLPFYYKFILLINLLIFYSISLLLIICFPSTTCHIIKKFFCCFYDIIGDFFDRISKCFSRNDDYLPIYKK